MIEIPYSAEDLCPGDEQDPKLRRHDRPVQIEGNWASRLVPTLWLFAGARRDLAITATELNTAINPVSTVGDVFLQFPIS